MEKLKKLIDPSLSLRYHVSQLTYDRLPQSRDLLGACGVYPGAIASHKAVAQSRCISPRQETEVRA